MLLSQHTLALRSQQGKISTNIPAITLADSLSQYTVKDAVIVEFFKTLSSFESSQNIIAPISCRKTGESWTIVYNRFGSSLADLSEEALLDCATDDFIKQFSVLYYRLKDLKPFLSLKDIFVMEKQPLKVQLRDCCSTAAEYLQNYHQTLMRIYKERKEVLSKLKEIHEISVLKDIYSPPKEGKTLSKLLELKLNLKLPPYKIATEQEEMDWIFSTLGFSAAPKYELVYNGIQHGFDPVPHLKAISKQLVFYLIEATNGARIAFYSGIRYEWTGNSLFGGYVADKQKKAMILNLTKRSRHPIEEEQFAVGYGTEVLLAIGKVDIVFSAFNVANVSYFPVSYKGDEKCGVTAAADLLGERFTLRQFQAYKLM